MREVRRVHRRKILALLVIIGMIAPIFVVLNTNQSTYDVGENKGFETSSSQHMDFNDLFSEKSISYSWSGNYYPENWSFIKYLKDNPNEYRKVWEPWLTKAAIHSIVTNDNGTMIAFGGGYLYDNEIHIYRWNYVTQNYEKVWDSGDGIISGDVVSLDFADTDNNRLMEVVAGSADGHIYVFEQRHVFDPITNTEHMFDLVWKSEFLGPVWRVMVYDMDLDYDPDIVAGTWNNKIYMFEYEDHSGYPYSTSHWISYKMVWESPELSDKILSFVCGDINGNGLPDMLVGLRNGELVLFENNGTIIQAPDYYLPLPQDNSYKIIWSYNYGSYAPILDMSIGDLDGDGIDEVSIIESGREAYVLDYSETYDRFDLIKLYYPPKSFELDPPHPIDYYIDWMISGINVYYNNSTAYIAEPSEEIDIYDNNTAMGGPPDGKYSEFLPNATHNATAVLDFGMQEEAAGDGTYYFDICMVLMYKQGYDLVPNRTSMRIYVSKYGYKYVEVKDYFVYDFGSVAYLFFDIDGILKNNSWKHIRYLKIVVPYGYKFAIDAIITYDIDKQLSDVTSTYITELDLDYYGEKNYLLFGTVNGRLVIFQYNDTIHRYEMVYDSLSEDMFSLENNIWDIVKVMPDKRFPYWTKYWEKGIDLGTKKMIDFEYFDIDHDDNYDLLIGTDKGTVLLYRYQWGTFINDSYATSKIFGDINGVSKSNLTLRMCDILNNKPNKPGIELILGYYKDVQYNLRIFYLYNPAVLTYSFEYTYDVAEHEITGKLYSLFHYSGVRSPVTFDVADVDGNGYKDIVLAFGGKLYMLWYLYGDASGPVFMLDEKYFEDIPNLLKNKKPFKPQLVDFNNDGVYDLVISYLNKNGTTYFENIGTVDEPIWVQKRTLFANSLRSLNPVTNFAFNGYTLSEIEKIGDTYWLIANKRGTSTFILFNGETDRIQTLALATYPLLTVINMAPVVPKASENFGYHIFEVWSNHRDLHGWTQAVDYGDVDSDGKGEVIVGDFDNNVYIFEHMINNTYKRAFRSGDLYYEIVTNTSPYYSEELVGLQGTFKRRIWEHARYLVANTDIDGDAKLEAIVATKYQIFVFEHERYENYILEYRYSFLEHPLGSEILEQTNGISAFAYAGDMDYNGYGEIIVALDNYLFVLEMTEDGFIETFSSLVSIFADKIIDYAATHKYYLLDPVFVLPGNPYTYYYDLMGQGVNDYSEFEIRAIIIVDLDNNGNKEIIIGGLNRSLECPSLRDGFLYAIENEFGTYYIRWSAPDNVLYENAINALDVDDQDYDGKKELYVAGDKGVDVFEASDTSYLEYITTISGDPNHPFVNNMALYNNSPLAYDDEKFDDADIVVTPQGRIFVIYQSEYTITATKTTEIFYSYSDDGGKTWYGPYILAPTTDYSGTPLFEKFPRALYHNGSIYIAWYASIDVSGIVQYNICYRTLDPQTLVKGPIEYPVKSMSDVISDLSIWRFPVKFWYVSYDMGISYINYTDRCIYPMFRLLGSWYPLVSKKIEYIYDGNWTLFFRHDIAYIGAYRWLIAFTMYIPDQYGRRLIWTSITDTSFSSWTMPVTIYDSYELQEYPNVEYIESENVTVVSGMRYTVSHYWEPFLCVSMNGGQTWSKPKYLYRYHPRVKIVCSNGVPRYQFLTRTYEDLGMHRTYALRVSARNGYFVYSMPAMITYNPLGTIGTVYDIIVGVRDSYEWLRFDVSKVDVLAVGDTDGDWRREVIVNMDDYVVVVEISDNNESYRRYTQKAILGPFNRTIQDIVVGDANGNGWDEIIIATDYGNVYSYEFLYSTWLGSDFRVPNEEFSKKYLISASLISFYGLGNIDNDPQPEYYFTTMYGLYVYDHIWENFSHMLFYPAKINYTVAFNPLGEDKIDFILALNNGTVYRIDGETFSVVAEKDIATDGFVDIILTNTTVFLANKSGFVIELTLDSLSEVFTYNLDAVNTTGIGIGYYLGGISRIFIQLDNDTLYCIDYQSASLAWTIHVSPNIEGSVFTFDINSDGLDELIACNYTNGMYDLMVIDILNGSILSILETKSRFQYRWYSIVNIDGDEFPDIFAYTEMGEIVISTKNFDVIWMDEFRYYKEFYEFVDYDGDGRTEILYSFNGGTILSNSYGCPILYYGIPNNRTFMTLGDIDIDGEIELVGYLENGVFVVVNITQFNESLTGVAYLEPKIVGEKQIVDEMDYGLMAIADINKDDNDDIIISNTTNLIVYDFYMGDYVFKTDLRMQIREILTGDMLGYGYNSTIVVYGDYDVTIFDNTGQIIVDMRVVSGKNYIVRAFIGNFMGSAKDEVIVVTTLGTYCIDESGIYYLLTIGSNTYPIVGDFNGNGYLDIAYKMLGTSTLYVYEGDGTFMWSKTLSTSSGNMFACDVFTLDINKDGIDDIIFTDFNGTIAIYDGSSGTAIYKIPTGIHSYALSVDIDRMFGTGGLVVKYLNYGLYVFKLDGSMVYHFPDMSTSGYIPAYVSGIGYTYFAMTPGKIFGVNRYDRYIYKSLSYETVAFNRMVMANEIYIVSLAKTGYVTIINIADLSSNPIRPSTLSNGHSDNWNGATLLLITAIPPIAVAIYVKKKE